MSLLALWADGALAAPDAPVFRADDRGALLGDGVFETIRAAGGRALFLDAHLARMRGGAKVLGLPFDEAAVRAAVADVLAAAPDGALRVALSRGPGTRGLAPVQGGTPVLVASVSAAAPPASARLRLVSVRRNEGSPASRHKLASYADMILARAEATAAGGDDALVLNNQGRPVCTSMANLFARIGGVYVTPPASQGALPGIVRGVVLDRAGRAGLRVEERPLSLAEVQAAPLFRSNSLLGVTPAYLPGCPRAADDDPLIALYAEAERSERGAP